MQIKQRMMQALVTAIVALLGGNTEDLERTVGYAVLDIQHRGLVLRDQATVKRVAVRAVYTLYNLKQVGVAEIINVADHITRLENKIYSLNAKMSDLTKGLSENRHSVNMNDTLRLTARGHVSTIIETITTRCHGCANTYQKDPRTNIAHCDDCRNDY
tara:strand:+ start:538 stop:1011 length:474 start_codon:yes stop_codon:yes gene_type:complete